MSSLNSSRESARSVTEFFLEKGWEMTRSGASMEVRERRDL
jgi:hypothetical protein